MVHNILIIGSGPAGWTAAIYAARANLKPVLLEGALSAENQKNNTLPMGQLALTSEVENYPGFPIGDMTEYLSSSLNKDRLSYLPPHGKHGVSGPELVELIRQQAVNFGVEIISEDALKIDTSARPMGPFYVLGSDGVTYEARAVVVATGARANWLNIPSEERFKNRGVSACAVCDGALPRFKDQAVAVVGGGDSAIEEAVYLANFSSHIYLIHRRNEFRASKIMVKKAVEHPKIEILWNRTVSEVLGDDKAGVTGLRLNSTTGEPDVEISVAGMFTAIGHTPNTVFLEGTLELDQKKYIRWVQPGRTFTSVEGIFAAGDCADSYYRQAITAAASGCMAALDAERWLAVQEL